MLLALLVHLLIIHLLTAREYAPPKKDTEYIVKHIDTCPDVGYYFKREASPNAIEPGPCYLCFCQEDSTAVCWKRDNRRCNVESFHYHGVGKRNTRIRRSPGLADIFFRDASRDFFNKNEKTQCKPFESSFSDDCPPVDWCIGCTVCDCDANGRWDCHILSFCPENKGKKKSKRKGPMRKLVAQKPVQNKSFKSPTKNIPKRTPGNTLKNNNKAKTKTTPPIKRGGNNKTPPEKRVVKKSVPVKPDWSPVPQKRKTPIRYKRISPGKPKTLTTAKIIKKNIATHSPIDIRTSKVNLEMEIAQKVMKKVMSNLRKSINGEMLNMSKIAIEAQKNKGAKKNYQNLKKSNTKPKPASGKKVNKRQVKKPQRKPPQRKPPPKKPQKKPTWKSVKKPTKRPMKRSNGKPTRKPPPKTYVRNKRDLVMANTDTESTTIISQEKLSGESENTTGALSLTPMTSKLLIPDSDNCTHSPVGSSTVPDHEYYKYLVGAEQPVVEIDRPMKGKVTSEVNMTETVFNLIGTEKTPALFSVKSTINNDKANKATVLPDINPEANDLKYSKWSHVKILKEKKMKTGSEKYKGLVKILTPANKTIVPEDYEKKVHGKDIERKLNFKKYNLVKMLNLPRCLTHNVKNQNNSNAQSAITKIGNLQSLLAKLLREFHKNNTSRIPKRNRKVSVLRYLKRIFNKIFKHKQSHDRFNKHHIIDTLCENFGPCKVSIKDKYLLNSKLAELDAETTKILKTVGIIKGLLKLLDIPKKSESDSSKIDNFRSDVQKLNNILKGSFSKDDKIPMSATQLTQIEYVKRNTQEFIKSVSKFASLLNEIISLLTKHDTNVSKKSNRILRNSAILTENFTKEDPFQDLKHLLVRYNLVQNSFMKRMYEQLNNFENKMNEKPKVSEVKDLNNSVAIENFSRNIIQNLRKLKRLAHTMSFSGRSKRETRDDDAIEYLLMLMEYLLKQNHPLDAAPVNDGIDLLIEAIKNAPDIKPIRKKVLEYTPATFTSDSTTTPSTTSFSTEGSLSDDDSPSDSDKNSSEDSGRAKQLEETEDNLKSKMEENKELAEMVIEEDRDPEYKFQFDRRLAQDKLDENTEMTFYNRAEENAVLESENTLETTTAPTLELEMSDKVDKKDKEEVVDTINIEKPIALESNNLDKPNAEGEVEGKKFEVFTGDMDEEGYAPGTITVSESLSTVTTEIITQAKKSRTKMRHLNLESYDSRSIDKKSKLEWIEENFGKESEKPLTDLDGSNITTVFTKNPKTVPITTDKADVSILTREVTDETDKKRKAKINAEDVMFKKQMDLLNSLDYGTEKTEFEESESKNANDEDRYSSDAFPSYFV